MIDWFFLLVISSILGLSWYIVHRLLKTRGD
jgi:hypothetical protein